MIKREITTGYSWYEVLKDNEQYNFVAVAFTPWHAISIDALLLYLQSKKEININAAIIITAHPDTGYTIDESAFTNKCSTYYKDPFVRNSVPDSEDIVANDVKVRDRIMSVLSFYKYVFSDVLFSRKKALYYVTNSYPYMDLVYRIATDYGRNVIIAYCEEGVASYMGTIPDPNIRQWKRNIKGFVKYIRYQVIGNYVYRVIHKKESCKLLKKTANGFKVNQSILPYYKKVFETINNQFPITIDKKEMASSVVICTTAWDRNRIVENDDLRVLKMICDHLRNKGISIYLKTHPRDSFFINQSDYLGAKLLNVKGVAMECICEYCLPLAIISFSSTILVTAKIFWNIPVWCLTDMINRESVDDMYLKEIDNFKSAFGQFVSFAQTIEDIEL